MTYRLILLRHGHSDWNAKNLFTGWVDVDLNAQGVEEAQPRRRAAARARPAARRTAHLGAAPRDPHREHRARGGRPAVDRRTPVLAAERAPLRRPAGQGQEADPGGARRGAVHAVPPLLRHPAAGDRARLGVRPGRRPPVRRPAARAAAGDRVPQGRRRADAALLVRRDRAGPARRARPSWSPPTATRSAPWSSTSTTSTSRPSSASTSPPASRCTTNSTTTSGRSPPAANT